MSAVLVLLVILTSLITGLSIGIIIGLRLGYAECIKGQQAWLREHGAFD
jgi:hypothetical protein